MGSWNRKRRSVEKNGWNPNEAWSLACSGISALFSKVWQMHHDKEDNLRGKWMRDTHYISYYLWHFSVNRGIIFKSLWNKIFFKKPTKVICLGKEETEGVSLTCAWCPRAHSPSYTCLVPAEQNTPSEWSSLLSSGLTDCLSPHTIAQENSSAAQKAQSWHLQRFHQHTTTSHHHPRWVQLFRFQAVKGKYINFFLFLIFFFKFPFFDL